MTASAIKKRSRYPLDRPERHIARTISEIVVPVVTAMLPFGLVLADALPVWVIEGAFIVLTIFVTSLVATYAPLPVGHVILACLGVVVVALSQRPNLYAVTVIPLMAFVMQWTDLRKMIRRFATTSIVLFLTVVALYFLVGFNADNDLYAWRPHTGDFDNRLSLGFTHPNRVMMEWAVIVVGFVAFTTARTRAWLFLPLACGSAYLFVATDSRTSAILAGAFLATGFLLRNSLERPARRGVRWLTLLAPTVFVFTSFLLARLSSDAEINALLTGRPAIYTNLLANYSLWAPFGHAIVEDEIVDNGFLHLFLSKGVLLGVLYIATLTALISAPARLSRRTVLVTGTFLMLSLFETHLLNFAMLFLVLASLELDRRKEFPLANPPRVSRGSRPRPA